MNSALPELLRSKSHSDALLGHQLIHVMCTGLWKFTFPTRSLLAMLVWSFHPFASCAHIQNVHFLPSSVAGLFISQGVTWCPLSDYNALPMKSMPSTPQCRRNNSFPHLGPFACNLCSPPSFSLSDLPRIHWNPHRILLASHFFILFFLAPLSIPRLTLPPPPCFLTHHLRWWAKSPFTSRPQTERELSTSPRPCGAPCSENSVPILTRIQNWPNLLSALS